MPIKTEMNQVTQETATSTTKSSFRPPKEVLDIFWVLADGTDQQRAAESVKLARIIKESEGTDRVNLLSYCKGRLIKGLSSGRKFARVGFAVTLAQLLRAQLFDTEDILSFIEEKLKPQRHEKSSKSEVGGIYLGRAFGLSSIVQAGSLSKMGGESLSTMTAELLALGDKKSYLKAVCNKTIEDLLSQVSTDEFGEHVWSKLRDKMKAGWEGASLDTISLLLACREKFPDVVNKKFLKKHWGFPVLCEENDEKLYKTTLDTAQREKVLLECIIPAALSDGRDVLSLWNGFGGRFMAGWAERRTDQLTQRQTLGMKIAKQLFEHASAQQMLALIVTPSIAGSIFHSITQKDDPIATAADLVFEQLYQQLKKKDTAGDDDEDENNLTVLEVVEQLWKLDCQIDGQHQRGERHVNLVGSANFLRLLELLNEKETKAYADMLMSMIKGKDKWEVLSEHAGRKSRQFGYCLRQLQHLIVSPCSTFDLQSHGLMLLLRLSFFQLDTKVKSLLHCESCVSFNENQATRKLCEAMLYKSLNAISTSNSGNQKRSHRESYFIKLLFTLCSYLQELLSNEKVTFIQEWTNKMQEDWNKLYGTIVQSQAKQQPQKSDAGSTIPALQLLLCYLGLQMLVDYKSTSEMLQDVCVCFTKATSGNQQDDDDSEDPAWVDVLTEVLLHLMSLPSHLGRVITATVFRMLSPHMGPTAVRLITEVLIPKKVRGDDADGVMVEDGQADDEDDEDDDDDEEEVDDDESETSSVENEGDDEANSGDEEEEDELSEMEDEEEEADKEEDIHVDEEFRQAVKQALGDAAGADDGDDDDNDEEEKDQSDLSDSEMFKLDDMLAEVFRQRKKAGAGKKARLEKKAQLDNFRLRVLDLVENMIKGERCGDFLLDLLKPLLLLSMRTRSTESQPLCARAQTLFAMLKSKAKSLTDNVHTAEEQQNFFEELLQLARGTSDPTHMQSVSTACYIVMNVSCKQVSNKTKSLGGCSKLFKEALSQVMNKKQSKPHFSFFTSIIEMNPVLFQSLSKDCLSNLKEEDVKIHTKTVSCSILTNLCKRTDTSASNSDGQDSQKSVQWMTEASKITSQFISIQKKGEVKAILLKEIMQLMLALQARTDCFEDAPFDLSVKAKLAELKSKFNTDLRRLANKLIAGIERCHKKENKEKKKKRKVSESEMEMPQKKRMKLAT